MYLAQISIKNANQFLIWKALWSEFPKQISHRICKIYKNEYIAHD